MIGGFKIVSRVALVAAAGMVAGSVAAQAADLGGNCCADLEERVAELEATTARKGNRRVSLEVSGHVNEMMMFWSGDQFDPGFAGNLHPDDTGFLVATNNNSRSRFRFRGSAKINADWSAGFLIEIGVRGTNNSQGVQAGNLNVKSGLDVRHEALYLQSRTLGTIWLGHTGSATEGITEICLGCTSGQGPDTGPYLGAFRPFGAGGLTWQGLAVSDSGRTFAGEGDRRDIVMYQTPSIVGFILSAAVGSDEFYDVALRYAGEFGGFRIAAGVGYQKSEEQRSSTGKGFAGSGAIVNVVGVGNTVSGCVVDGNNRADCESIGASASIMHVPSGLYIAGSYGQNKDNNDDVLVTGKRDEGYYITGGINRRFMALGATNVYGEYGKSERKIGYAAGFKTEMQWYGAGISQTIDAAAMDVYFNYKHFEGDANVPNNISDLDVFALGAIIRF